MLVQRGSQKNLSLHVSIIIKSTLCDVECAADLLGTIGYTINHTLVEVIT